MQHTDNGPGSSSDQDAAYIGARASSGGHLTATGHDTREKRLADLWDLIEAGRPAWHDRAACAGQGPDLWFNPAKRAEGQAVCAGCPARTECAAAGEGQVGIWGGIERSLPADPTSNDGLNSVDRAVIALITANPFQMSARRVGEQTGMNGTRSRIVFQRLIEQGHIVTRTVDYPYEQRRKGQIFINHLTVTVFGPAA